MKRIFLLFTFCFLATSLFSQATHYNITGKIIDKNSGMPLPGASVFAENTTFGVATDADGNFKLKLPNGGYELIVTFTGYETESMLEAVAKMLSAFHLWWGVTSHVHGCLAE